MCVLLAPFVVLIGAGGVAGAFGMAVAFGAVALTGAGFRGALSGDAVELHGLGQRFDDCAGGGRAAAAIIRARCWLGA